MPLDRIIDALGGLRVLIIGDVMLDTYLSGPSERLCPEAPVPVVAVSQANRVPGGAANVAANARTLGAEVRLASVVGGDREGSVLADALARLDIDTTALVRRAGRATLTKTRVTADGHMLVRFDEGSSGSIDADAEQALVAGIENALPRCDAVVVSDYGYGVITPRVAVALTEAQGRSRRVLGVDAKDLLRYRGIGVTVMKPNYALASRLAGVGPVSNAAARADALLPHGERLLATCGAGILAVTLDADGALLFEQGRPPYRTYARPHPQRRAAGAGDTFLAALTLGLAAGADTPEAAELASAASAVVMAKEATATCSDWELAEYLWSSRKELSPDRAARRAAFYRSQGRRVVLASGCFDILHPGHTAYLNQAKALGDVLIVGVNSDRSVRGLKGAGRPVNGQDDRAAVLSALSCVDHVVIFDEDDPRALVRVLRPHVFAKGGDYTRETLPEAATVEEFGGVVRILPYYPSSSTTGLIERLARGPKSSALVNEPA